LVLNRRIVEAMAMTPQQPVRAQVETRLTDHTGRVWRVIDLLVSAEGSTAAFPAHDDSSAFERHFICERSAKSVALVFRDGETRSVAPAALQEQLRKAIPPS
jgi:hypothetical protein